MCRPLHAHKPPESTPFDRVLQMACRTQDASWKSGPGPANEQAAEAIHTDLDWHVKMQGWCIYTDLRRRLLLHGCRWCGCRRVVKRALAFASSLLGRSRVRLIFTFRLRIAPPAVCLWRPGTPPASLLVPPVAHQQPPIKPRIFPLQLK